MRAIRVGILALGVSVCAGLEGAPARAEEPVASSLSGVTEGPVARPVSAFPEHVRSLRVVRDAWAQLGPGIWKRRIGQIAKGTRVAWTAATERLTKAPEGQCPRWIAIEPKGWLCETDVEPSELEPSAIQLPVIRDGYLLPERYGEVLPTPENPSRGGRISDFGGIWAEGDDGLTLPLAWAQGRGDRARPKPVPVRSAPSAEAPIVRMLPQRTIVAPTAYSSDKRFAQIEDGAWIAVADLHIAAWTEQPPDVKPGERWIDVDLDQQVLVAYEGTRPIAATLIASGLANHQTPIGKFRVKWKHAVTRMAGTDYRAQVPWTMYYADMYALHAAYWHDRFGQHTSHGCINVAPRDARKLFAWSDPPLPPGWNVVYGVDEDPGSLVRVRRTGVRTPPLDTASLNASDRAPGSP